jgi:hypothetical protein
MGERDAATAGEMGRRETGDDDVSREARATSDERDIFRTARAARGRAREMEASESREDEASMPLPAFADDANRALAREIEVRRGRSRALVSVFILSS